jgi:antitoxin ParD1/3/4
MATLNVSLTPELLALINGKVESGMYHSASEVVRAGLRLLQEQEVIRQMRLEELRREIAIGTEQLDRGDFIVFSSGEEVAEWIEREGRKRKTEVKDPK